MEKPSVDLLPNSNKPQNSIPFNLVPLPSKGLLYPKDHPFHNCEHVEIREMTTMDENILYSEALIKKGTVLNQLITSCVLNKSLDPSTLLAGDKAAILLAIRISGFGQDYKVHLTCKDCNKQYDHDFNLSQIEIKPLTAKPKIDGQNLFEFILPKSKQRVEFCLMTDGVDVELNKIQQRKKKLSAAGAIETRLTDNLKLLVKSIDGETDGGKISSMIEKMNPQDSRELRKYMRQIEPDLLMKQMATCAHCGCEEVKDIPLGLSFFWPDADQ